MVQVKMLADCRLVSRHFESPRLVLVLDMVFAEAVEEEEVCSRLELGSNPGRLKSSFPTERMDRRTASIRSLVVKVTD